MARPSLRAVRLPRWSAARARMRLPLFGQADVDAVCVVGGRKSVPKKFIRMYTGNSARDGTIPRALYPQGVQLDSPVTFSRFELERTHDAHRPWRLHSGIMSKSRVHQCQYHSYTLISRYKSSGLAGRLKYYHVQSVRQRTGPNLPSGIRNTK